MTSPSEAQASKEYLNPRTRDVPAKITEYLSSGGLFNPELMDHEAVRDVLIHARDVIEIFERERCALNETEGDWRVKAAEWLRQRAAKQEKTNAECPAHAAAYESWRRAPDQYRWLAECVLAERNKGTAESPPCVFRDGCRKPETCAIKGHCDAPPDMRRAAETSGELWAFPHACQFCGERFKQRDARGIHESACQKRALKATVAHVMPTIAKEPQ